MGWADCKHLDRGECMRGSRTGMNRGQLAHFSGRLPAMLCKELERIPRVPGKTVADHRSAAGGRRGLSRLACLGGGVGLRGCRNDRPPHLS